MFSGPLAALWRYRNGANGDVPVRQHRLDSIKRQVCTSSVIFAGDHQMLHRFPYLSADKAALVLRIVTPLLFMIHALVRLYRGTLPQFSQFMDNIGFPAPQAVVWAITIVELVAGTLILLNLHVRWAASALAAIAFGGIVLIHARLGWFVGEHGTGGSEYSVALLVMLLVLAARDAEKINQR